jgi:hypothetical protein
MPEYRVLSPSYIDGKLIDAQMIENAADKGGVIVEYEGIASDNLELVKGDPAKIEAGHRAKLLAEAQKMGIAGVGEASSLSELQHAIGVEKRRRVEFSTESSSLNIHLPKSPLARA